MDFARELTKVESVVSKSKIRYLEPISSTISDEAVETGEIQQQEQEKERERIIRLDNAVIKAANKTATEMFLERSLRDSEITKENSWMIDCKHYTERITPIQDTIKAGDLVVIQNSFDDLDFVYCKPGEVYGNRNGQFHHIDFINKPYGTKLRSRNFHGYGYCFLLKPTPELWTRSLKHRTQLVHELDQSQIIFQLYIKPNDVVVESGTGSGAMSHAILRTIAPAGQLHTYEFNKHRCDIAKQEFQQHGLDHLVTIHHKDVCYGLTDDKKDKNSNDEEKEQIDNGQEKNIKIVPGFDLPGQSVDAVFLDLPEPWFAVPHVAYILKPSTRFASYSPCIEQTHQTIKALELAGFHSIKTMEYRLQEYYVDEIVYENPPTDKRILNPIHNPDTYKKQPTYWANPDNFNNNKNGNGDDTGAEADNEISETDTNEAATKTSNDNSKEVTGTAENNSSIKQVKKKRKLVARPFVSMRGHSAFLTFATSSTVPQPDPNNSKKI